MPSPEAIKRGGARRWASVLTSPPLAPALSPLSSPPLSSLEMAASNIAAQHYASYSPPESFPNVRQASGSGPTFVSLTPGFNDLPPTLYIRGDLGVPFVQSATFGDKDTQEELRAKFDAGEKLKVVTYFTPMHSDVETFHYFAEKLNRWANALVKEKFSKQAKNSRFQPCSIVRADEGSIKIALDADVLADLQISAGSESAWSYPRGVYDLVFQITGMWVSPQGCGFIFKARRIALVEARVYSLKNLAPACYLFGNEYDEVVAEETASLIEEEVATVKRARRASRAISDE